MSTDKKNNSGRIPLSIIGDKIHSETIKKQLKHFRLNEEYRLSPNTIKSKKRFIRSCFD